MIAGAAVAPAVAGAVLLLAGMAALLVWVGYILHVGMLDAQDLADKTGFRWPHSALQWPELNLGAVVAQPESDRLVLVSARRPAHPAEATTLLLCVQSTNELRRLSSWCEAQASITARSTTGDCVEFRRRRTVERVLAWVVDESPA
jgi:hypothetical protein